MSQVLGKKYSVCMVCTACSLQSAWSVFWGDPFLSQDDLHSRYELLYPSFGPFLWVPSDLGVSLWGSGFPSHEPPFSPSNALHAHRSSGLARGLMARLPGFASHGSSLHLGAVCQLWKLLDVSGTQPPLWEAVVKCS